MMRILNTIKSTADDCLPDTKKKVGNVKKTPIAFSMDFCGKTDQYRVAQNNEKDQKCLPFSGTKE